MRHRYLYRSLLLLATALLMLLAMVGLFFYESHRIIAADEEQRQINVMLPPLRDAVAGMLDAETGQRGYLLTGNPLFLKPYLRATADIDAGLDTAYEVMQHYHPSYAVDLERAIQIRRDKFAELQQIIDLFDAGQREAALEIVQRGEGLQLMNGARMLLAPMIEALRERRLQISAETHQTLQHAKWLMVVASLLLITVVALAIWLLMRILRENDELSLRLQSDATHDVLTGLPNRRLLDDLLPTLVEQARRRASLISVIYIDLDGFKQVNDEIGHAAGDVVLKLVAGRVVDVLRRSDVVARIGGDEFAVVAIDSDQRETRELAKRLLVTLSAPLPDEFRQYGIGASIGIAIFPAQATTVEQLMQAADQAMYAAKRAGKGRICFAGEGADSESAQS